MEMHIDDGQDMFALPVPEKFEPQPDSKDVGTVVPIVGGTVFIFVLAGLGLALWALVK
jgi:hypothetical protein